MVEREPQPHCSPTENDRSGISAAHQKVEAPNPGYIAVTRINSNKLSANTKVDIETHGKERDEFGEGNRCEGESDLTTRLRERKDLLVKFLSGQDVTPEHAQQSEVRSATLHGRVVHVACGTRVGTACGDGLSGGLERSCRKGHYCSQHLEIARSICEKGLQQLEGNAGRHSGSRTTRARTHSPDAHKVRSDEATAKRKERQHDAERMRVTRAAKAQQGSIC